MTHRIPQSILLLLPLVAVMVTAIGCGGGPEFLPEQATTLIMAQFPDAELELRNTSVDEQGRGVAFAGFNGQTVSFYFQPLDEGWALDAVDFDGSLFYIKDLEQIGATMLLMGTAATALETYKADVGSYPAGDSTEVLQVLIPDYIDENTDRQDAWNQAFHYESDGGDYTLISGGADMQQGTDDDIVLHSGEFVGANTQGGQGQ